MTAKLIDMYQNKCAIRSLEDDRLIELQAILDWATGWHHQWESNGKPQKNFISWETYEDLLSMLMGTLAIVQLKFAE